MSRRRYWNHGEAVAHATALARAEGRKYRVLAVYTEWWPWPVWAVSPLSQDLDCVTFAQVAARGAVS